MAQQVKDLALSLIGMGSVSGPGTSLCRGPCDWLTLPSVRSSRILNIIPCAAQ